MGVAAAAVYVPKRSALESVPIFREGSDSVCAPTDAGATKRSTAQAVEEGTGGEASAANDEACWDCSRPSSTSVSENNTLSTCMIVAVKARSRVQEGVGCRRVIGSTPPKGTPPDDRVWVVVCLL